MSVIREELGTTKNGEVICAYTLSNANGMSVKVLNFGAIVMQINVPDRNGKVEDVVLGYDKAEGYFTNGSMFGAAVGPCANRTGNARFEIDGQTYELAVNDGVNNLHTHLELGYHKRIWDAQTGEEFVRFSLQDEDGSLGMPGNREVVLTYTLTEKNRLEIHYHMESDKKTLFNMTNHSYFNLEGQGNGTIENHIVSINASAYTAVAKGGIPTGKFLSVEGTPMDLRKPIRVGEKIRDEYEQLQLTGGYDHCYVIDDYDGSLKLAAYAKAPISGRTMKTYTNVPGIQFYAGNFIGREEGKGGVFYDKRSGLCFEAQFYPDAANKPQFPSAIFGPERFYDYTTIYEFRVE